MNADAEVLVRDLLRTHITAEKAGQVGCTNDVPATWGPGSKPHLSVFTDGAAASKWPVAAWPTVRVVARAGANDAAKDLARWAEAKLLGHDGTAGVSQVRSLLGVVPVTDPDTGHSLAWFTVRAGVRTVAS